jgi:hypothetical protein
VVADAAVEDADEAVGECSQGLVVCCSALALAVVERSRAG